MIVEHTFDGERRRLIKSHISAGRRESERVLIFGWLFAFHQNGCIVGKLSPKPSWMTLYPGTSTILRQHLGGIDVSDSGLARSLAIGG